MEADLEAEIAPPPPPPTPSKPKTVAGVSPSEALEWTGSAFAGAIELEQEDGSKRRTPAEWSPWYGVQKSIIFQRALNLPLGIILEEAGGGAIRVAEVREGGSGEQCDIRPGDVLRACSAISSTKNLLHLEEEGGRLYRNILLWLRALAHRFCCL